LGRLGKAKILHKPASSNCTQRTPAGLPNGILGIGDEIDGAIQHAAQPNLQANGSSIVVIKIGCIVKTLLLKQAIGVC
jgi:hypothetical protein